MIDTALASGFMQFSAKTIPPYNIDAHKDKLTYTYFLAQSSTWL